jgi:hypothetical protein
MATPNSTPNRQSTDDMSAPQVTDTPKTQDEEDGLTGPGTTTFYSYDGDLYREQYGYAPEVLVPSKGWYTDTSFNPALANVLTPEQAQEMAGDQDINGENAGDLDDLVGATADDETSADT